MGGKGTLLHGTGLLTDPNTVFGRRSEEGRGRDNGSVTLITITDIDKDGRPLTRAITRRSPPTRTSLAS